jgi:transcriptional regulator with XRE-family HTH domain
METMNDGRDRHRREELTGFLRSRRARLRPEKLGLVTVGTRRVSGLRREETARLAGMSTDYYIRLEQGRAGWPSDQVLSSISRALQLSPEEEDHLFRLARPPVSGSRERTLRKESVRSEVWSLLRTLDGPAFVVNGAMEMLACNELARRLVSDVATTPATRSNIARMIFTDPAARDYYLDWDAVAQETCGHMRLSSGRALDDADFQALVDELSSASSEFRQLWKSHVVHQKSHGEKRLHHPEIGDVTVWYETLALPTDNDQMLVTYTAEEGSPSKEAIRRLLDTPEDDDD